MLFSPFLKVARALIYTTLPTGRNRVGVTKKPAGSVSGPQHVGFAVVKNPYCTAKEAAKVFFVY